MNKFDLNSHSPKKKLSSSNFNIDNNEKERE